MEEWRQVDGFSYYWVSNKGNLISVDRMLKDSRGIARMCRGHKIKLQVAKDHLGFRLIDDEGNRKWKYIHQLVALAFIPNPNSYPEVNHIDNNPYNNDVSNLEWCTHYQNMMWMHKTGRAKRTETWLTNLRNSQKPIYKAVVGTNISDGSQIEFESVNSTARVGFHPSSVSNCCNGKAFTHKGYTWKFKK